MPLKKSSSKDAFKENVANQIIEGIPTKQALAISYDIKRRAKSKKAKSNKETKGDHNESPRHQSGSK